MAALLHRDPAYGLRLRVQGASGQKCSGVVTYSLSVTTQSDSAGSILTECLTGLSSEGVAMLREASPGR